MSRLERANRSSPTADALEDDLKYLIERVSRISRGEERGVDAKVLPIRAALKNLRDAKAQLSAALLHIKE